eukprot:8287645-Lingulodinium_polyedra.AAC.1
MVRETRGLRTAAVADDRFDRIIAHGFGHRALARSSRSSATQQRLANRTSRTHHANTNCWRSHDA